MDWNDPRATPVDDMLAVAAAVRANAGKRAPLLLTDAEYEQALEEAGGDPDHLERQAYQLGFAGIHRLRRDP